MLIRDRAILFLFFTAPRFWFRVFLQLLWSIVLVRKPQITAASADILPVLDGGWVQVNWECSDVALLTVEGVPAFFSADGDALVAADHRQQSLKLTAYGLFGKKTMHLPVRYFNYRQLNAVPSATAMSQLGRIVPDPIAIPNYKPKQPIPRVAQPSFRRPVDYRGKDGHVETPKPSLRIPNPDLSNP